MNSEHNNTTQDSTEDSTNTPQTPEGMQQDYDGTVPTDVAVAAANPIVDPNDLFFKNPSEVPTQEGPLGIRYDFNDGARVLLPKGQWHVMLTDEESGNILFACDADEGWVVSTKKYFVQFGIKVWIRGEDTPILDHVMDLKDRPVLLKFPVGTLGDILGWFPYAEKFLQRHECILECVMADYFVELFQAQYPDMKLSSHETLTMQEPYASYRIGLFFGGNKDCQPIDFRQVGLHRTAGHILGVDPTEVPPRLKLGAKRTIKEPYVCIATKSSCQAKYWNNGYGWDYVVNCLKDMGYRVLAIDREHIAGVGFTFNHIPRGAEDFTGNLPLQERVDLLQYADFFIGLSSGLSWLAWGARVPVVLISGFTLPTCEFNTPYRVYSTHGCTGCWDDIDITFDHKDFLWCPRHKNTERMYECTRLITGKQVMGHIHRLMQDHKLTPPIERSKKKN